MTKIATKVEIYGTDWCGLTQRFRDDLEAAHVPFNYYNIERDSEAEWQVIEMNGGKRKFPMVVVGDKAMKRPSSEELSEALHQPGILEQH